MAICRIVQEALANVVKHTPGANVDITLEVGVEITLRVRSYAASTPSPPERSDGSGILGMRERAELLGGSFTAGPVADGWLVECRFPRAEAADAVPTITTPAVT